ncbi:MAG: hypothetical protein J0L84_03710 [Verrucomicrobia bacterium]|nr:hypothetical protein [Verrucomicrobiota bacterium]
MNSNTPPASRTRRQSPWLVWSLIALAVGIPSLALFSLVQCFRPGPDVRALGQEMRGGGAPGIALRLGTVPLSLIRFGLRRTPMDPEALAALDALQGVEVAVYPFAGAGDPDGVPRRLEAGSAALAARGWHRVVGVANDEVTVSVHARDDARHPDRLELCAAVLHDAHCVVVSVRGEIPDSLLASLGQRLPSPGRGGGRYLSNHAANARISQSMVSHP